MSFTSDVKNELCKTGPSDRHAEAECYGMLLLCRSFNFNKILFQTGSKSAAERLIFLLKHCFDIVAEMSVGGSARPTYSVIVSEADDRKRVLYKLGYKPDTDIGFNIEHLKTEGSVGAFVRGAFLSAWSWMSNSRIG